MAIPPARPDGAALITGASSGIGCEIAKQLHAQGHNVILVARRTHRLEELAHELNARRLGRVEIVPCDVADHAARAAMVETVEQLALDVDVLVLSAGFGMGGPFLQQDPDRIVQMARTNLESVFALARVLVPPMVTRGRGAVLVVSSMAGYQPWPNFGAYAATKAGATSFALMLGEELRKTGVSVTALTPGGVSTEFSAVAGMQRQEQTSMLARMSHPYDIARAGLDGLHAGAKLVMPTWSARVFVAVGRVMPRRIWLPVCRRLLA